MIDEPVSVDMEAMDSMQVDDALLCIQYELKSPKRQYNNFGKYKYRSCEDVLESLKPLLKKYRASLTLYDDIVNIGGFNYVKATASFKFRKEVISVNSFAKEPCQKGGMSSEQMTGSASSYARKYALNGLFLIDDTKDADFSHQTQDFKVSKNGSSGNYPSNKDFE
jgi:hypothetical protein